MSEPCTKSEEIELIHKSINNMSDTVSELKPLITTLKKIVEAEEAKTWLSIKVANSLKMTGIIIGILGGLFAIMWQVFKELKK